MTHFKHFLGEGYIRDEADTLCVSFSGMWRHVRFKKSKSRNYGLHTFLHNMSEEHGLGKIELHLWLELEKIASKYMEHMRVHGRVGNANDLTPQLVIESQETISDGYPEEQRIVGRNFNGFGINISPTGYVSVYGPLASTIDLVGMAHVEGGMLAFDYLAATRRRSGARLDHGQLLAVKAKLNEKWSVWANDNPELVAKTVQARQRLLARADAAWPEASRRVVDVVSNGRDLIKLTDRELYRKLAGLSLEVDLSSQWSAGASVSAPSTMEYLSKISSLGDLAEVSVGVAEAIANVSASQGRNDIAHWRQRIGTLGRTLIMDMAKEIMNVRSLFPSIELEDLDAEFFERMLDHFDFVFTDEDAPVFNATTAVSFVEGYFGMQAMSQDTADQEAIENSSQISSSGMF